jgi:hypothetical protein
LTFTFVGLLLTQSPTVKAAGWFILEPFFGKEFLFLNAKDEFVPTILTNKHFVFHFSMPPELDFPAYLTELPNLTQGHQFR